jgi:hypothetical protein
VVERHRPAVAPKTMPRSPRLCYDSPTCALGGPSSTTSTSTLSFLRSVEASIFPREHFIFTIRATRYQLISGSAADSLNTRRFGDSAIIRLFALLHLDLVRSYFPTIPTMSEFFFSNRFCNSRTTFVLLRATRSRER